MEHITHEDNDVKIKIMISPFSLIGLAYFSAFLFVCVYVCLFVCLFANVLMIEFS